MSPIQYPEAICMITPQPKTSGYGAKVLTNTFGLASYGCGVLLKERLDSGAHQPKA
jgi:hypothetical protein